LWKSDGTGASTIMVKDINPGSADSCPSVLIDMGGTLFFAASDGVNGRELWKASPYGLVQGVGGEVEPVSKAVVIFPWLALAVVITTLVVGSRLRRLR
jgi:hypothetical protein